MLILLVCYGASNLWLTSRCGRGMIEAKLQERTSLDWALGSITWSPWNGITIRDAQMLQPVDLRENLTDPVIFVEQLRVQPHWRQMLRGRLKLREVTMDSPKLTVSVEMLAALASGIEPQEELPPRAVDPEPRLPKADREQKPAAQENPEKPRPTQPTKKAVKPAPVIKPKKNERPPVDLPLRLKMRNASLHIVSVSKDIELLSVTGLTLDLPIFGEDAEGVVKIGAVKVPGLPEAVDIEQTVVWKRPYLGTEEKILDIGGLKVRFMGQLGMGRNTVSELPFLLDVAIDPQKLNQVEWLKYTALQVKAKQLEGRFRILGSLPSPMSWRADMLLAGDGVRVKEEHGSHDVVFDEVALPAVFRQGQLRWSGVRLIGEDISVLGNGQVSVRDGVLSVTRLVVSPEVETMLMRGLFGSHVVRLRDSWWENLDTPDRKMRNLVISGSLAEPMVDLGDGRTDLPIFQLVSTVFDFIREEMKEEGKELQVIPNGELLKGVSHENH